MKAPREEARRALQPKWQPLREDTTARNGRLTPRHVLAEVRRMGLRTPAEAAKLLRAERNAR